MDYLNRTLNGIYIAGINVELGSLEVSVDDILSKWTDEDLYDSYSKKTMTRENVKKRAGTNTLRAFSSRESLEDASKNAIIGAINNSGFKLSDISGIFFATASPTAEYTMPTPEVIIANKLGIENILAIPVGSGCVGAMFALRDAYLQLSDDSKNGREGVYVIGACDNTSIINGKKHSILFGIGASALVLTNKPIENGYSIDKLFLRGVISGNSIGVRAMQIDNATRTYEMDGGAVFSFVLNHALPAIKKGLELDKLTEDYFVVPHQASGKILGAVNLALGIPKDRVYREDIYEIGNLTVSSWPTALYNVLIKSFVRNNQTVVPIAFGAGNNAGGFIVRPFGNIRKIIGLE